MTDLIPIRRELLERVTKTCMFTMPADDYTELRAALAAQVQAEQCRDWAEDFGHENGYYTCKCSLCGEQFTGHKRRVICKMFADLVSRYTALEAELATVKKVAYGNMELLDENRNLQAELAKLRAVPDDYLIVPIQPTEEMRKRAQDYLAAEGMIVSDWLVHTAYTEMLAAAPSAPKADDPVKQMLLEALEKVDSEHEILGWMKTCELRRGRGSFGIAVMSDELALDWQSHQKNLERLIELRHAAIAAARKGEQ